jgi:hypothetical protein
MKANIFLTGIAELPCEISTITDCSVTFKIQPSIATAGTLQILYMMNANIYVYTDYISVSVKREHVDNIVFVD